MTKTTTSTAISEKTPQQPKAAEKKVISHANDKTHYAVFLHQKQQYKVSQGDRIYLPLIKETTENETITFDQVLLTEDAVGEPFLKNVKVEGKVLKPLHKDKKIIVFKYKSKKNYRVKSGHRRKLTLIQIHKIIKSPKLGAIAK